MSDLAKIAVLDDQETKIILSAGTLMIVHPPPSHSFCSLRATVCNAKYKPLYESLNITLLCYLLCY